MLSIAIVALVISGLVNILLATDKIISTILLYKYGKNQKSRIYTNDHTNHSSNHKEIEGK